LPCIFIPIHWEETVDLPHTGRSFFDGLGRTLRPGTLCEGVDPAGKSQ